MARGPIAQSYYFSYNLQAQISNLWLDSGGIDAGGRSSWFIQVLNTVKCR